MADSPAVRLIGGWTGLACHVAASCVAVGARTTGTTATGTVVEIRDGRPGTARQAAGAYVLDAVACGSPDRCEAVGRNAAYEGVVVTIRNGRPGAGRVVPGSSELTGVACPTPRRCWAAGWLTTGPDPSWPVGIGVVASIDRGLPGPAVSIAGTGALADIACPTMNLCETVGQSLPMSPEGLPVGVVVGVAGGAAGVPQPIPGSFELTGIACRGEAACTAVGGGPTDGPAGGIGVVVPVTRGVAGELTGVPGAFALYTVACAAAGSCEAVGSGLRSPLAERMPTVVVPVSRGAPGPAHVIRGVGNIGRLACVSASVCEALTTGRAGQAGLTPIAPPAILARATTLSGAHVGTLRLTRGSV